MPNVYGQDLTLDNKQKISKADPNYEVYAKQLGLTPPAPVSGTPASSANASSVNNSSIATPNINNAPTTSNQNAGTLPVDNAPDIVNPKTGLTDAQRAKLDYAYNRPGGQTAIDKQNIAYAIKNFGYKPPSAGGEDFSGVNDIATANASINSDQTADVANTNNNGAPDTRKTTADIMAELKSALAPTAKEPAPISLTETLEKYRTQYGVADLENQVNDLKAQEQEIMDQKRARITAERGKTVAMNVINGRISQVEQQENERLAVIQRSLANATNQLNTKYNVIDSLMKTTQADYQMAADIYDKQMNQNIQLYNAAKNILEEQKTDNDKEVDNARSSAQILLNSYQSAGKTYDSLSTSEQATLTKLSVTAGLGTDFFKNVLTASGGKEILTQIKSDDDTKMSIIYKDGTTMVIPTGLTAKPKASSGSGSGSSADKEEEKMRTLAADLIKSLDTGKISWAGAFDSMKAKYPYLENATIDGLLGGSWNPETGATTGRGGVTYNE